MSSNRQGSQSDPLGNRRAQRRAGLRVEVMVASEYGYHLAVTRDISTAGLGLESDLPLSPGTVLDVYFTLPSGISIEARAEVMRRDDSVLGLRFQGLRHEERVEVKSFCEDWRRELLERCSTRATAPDEQAPPSVVPSVGPRSSPTMTLRVPDMNSETQSETRVRAAVAADVREPTTAADGTRRR